MSNERSLVLSSPKELNDYLTRSKSAIANALPKHLKPERMLRLALTAFSTTPKLRECSAQSILASLVVASQIGLEPGVAGQGYLIPYKNTCTFVPGWQGLVGLLNNSGRATVWSGAVFEGDEWEFELGSNPRCFHRPGPNAGDPKLLRHVYACGQVNGSQMPVIEAWPIARVWAHRDRYNKVGNSHYSFQHPEMYARKVVVLQVLKYMPRSIELNNAMVASEAAEMGRGVTVQDGIVLEVETETEQLPAGNVGGTVTERAAAEKKPAGTLAAIIAKGAEINAGKVKIEKTAIAMRLMEPTEKLDALSEEKLKAILEAWDGEGGMSDRIQTPA